MKKPRKLGCHARFPSNLPESDADLQVPFSPQSQHQHRKSSNVTGCRSEYFASLRTIPATTDSRWEPKDVERKSNYEAECVDVHETPSPES